MSGCQIQDYSKRRKLFKLNDRKKAGKRFNNYNYKTTSSINFALPLKSERSIQGVFTSFKHTTENPLYRFYPKITKGSLDFIKMSPRYGSQKKCTRLFLKNTIVLIVIRMFI